MNKITNEKPIETRPSGDWISNAIIKSYEKLHDKAWLDKIVYGPPHATQKHTADDLVKAGYVGVYFKIN